MAKKKKISEKGKTKRRLLNRFSEMQGNRVVRPFSHLPPLEDDWYSFLNWLGRSLRLFRFLPYLKGSALRFLILSQDPKPFFPFSFPSISHQKNTIIRKLQNKNKKYWTYGEPLYLVWNFAAQKLILSNRCCSLDSEGTTSLGLRNCCDSKTLFSLFFSLNFSPNKYNHKKIAK